jgi:NitT/TauT family transport system substrate-binding protein
MVAAVVVSSGAAQAQEKFRIGVPIPDAAEYVGIYAAEKLGYYKEAKLDVDLIVFRGGNAAIEAMIAGALEMGATFPGHVAFLRTKNSKIIQVACIDSRPLGWHVMVKSDSPIKSLKELDGKNVGIPGKGGESDAVVLYLAKQNGIKVNTVPVGGGGLVPSLLNGQVDASIEVAAASFQLQQSGEARSLIDLGKDLAPICANAWGVTEDVMKKKPEVLKAVMAAMFKATRYLQDNRAWGEAYLKEFTKEKSDQLNQTVYEEIVMKLSRDGFTETSWSDESVRLCAEGWNVPDMLKVKREDIFTNAFLTKQ